MEQRNEPKTAEIVKALRCEGDVDKCKDCYFENTELGCVLCSGQEIESLAAARLEQLERENAEANELIDMQTDALSNLYSDLERATETIAELTARAEKAEAERDAANRVWREWYDNEGCGECNLCSQSPKTCGHFPKGANRVNGCECFSINVELVNRVFFNRYGFRQKEQPTCSHADPPRFTEAQMTFWREWYAMGARVIQRFGLPGNIIVRGETIVDAVVYNPSIVSSLSEGETLDLAELFGKDESK